MTKREILYFVLGVLFVVWLTMGIISVFGGAIANIFTTINSGNVAEYYQAAANSRTNEAIEATRSAMAVDWQDLVAHPDSFQGRWVLVKAPVVHVYSVTEFALGLPPDLIYLVIVIPDQSARSGFYIETPEADSKPYARLYQILWVEGLVGGPCKGHYPAKVLICGYISDIIDTDTSMPTPTRTPPPWWQFWVQTETPIPTGTPLPW